MIRLLLLLIPILLFCQCTSKQGQKVRSGYTGQSTMSPEERRKIKTQFDSLLLLAKNLKGIEKNEKSNEYMNKALSIAQQLNTDSVYTHIYFSLGSYFDNFGEYDLEVDYLYKAFEVSQKNNDYFGCARALNNMSWAYIQAFDYKKGIEQAKQGIQYAGRIADLKRQNRIKSLLYCNMAIALLENNLPDSALHYNNLAYSSFPGVKSVNLNHYAWIFATFGNIYLHLHNYGEAQKRFNTVIDIRDSSSVADAAVFTVSRYCHLFNQLEQYREAIAMGREGIRIARATDLKRYQIDVADELRYAFEKTHQTDSAYAYSKLATALRDDIFNTRKSIQLQNLSFNRDLKATELKFEVEKAKAEEKLKGAQMLRNILLIGLVLVMLFAGLFLYQRNKIKSGKMLSDELLLNILPGEVAEELKSHGSTLAKQFDTVTVMFTDFKNFTQIAEKLTPQQLVGEIDTCFKAFDQIIEKHNIEKIKTIGDAYMCAGGLPVSNTTHATDVVSAALEIQKFMTIHSEQKKAEGKEQFEVRIGIHTGPVVAGVVGIKKFAYDIWGDTVNIASRMESSGEAGRVNISSSTYELVKNTFPCSHRGKIHAKGKGEIDMYFVEQES